MSTDATAGGDDRAGSVDADSEQSSGVDEGERDRTEAEAWPAPPGQIPATADGLEERVWNALEDVLDLHVPISLVDMGMIYGVDADDATGDVTVQMTFPCMGCPGYEMLQGDVSARVGSVPDVEDVTVEVVWDPIWTKDRLTDRAREELTDCGIGI
jgi:metal-sulfur cluster biosynthetic enzyme